MKTYTISRFGLAGFIFFSLGSIIHVIAYLSIEPFLVSLILLFLGYVLLRLLGVYKKNQIHPFIVTFSLCWFWAGIAALYANFLNDSFQNTSDPAWFYEFVSGDNIIGLSGLSSSVENGGSILTWKIFYIIFDFFGFTNGRYIGIAVNSSFIAYTAVVGVEVVKRIFGDDNHRIRRLSIFFFICPIFWLFGAIHLRDASILLAVSLLVLIWIIYFKRPTSSNFIKLTLSTIIAFLVFGLLRTEFVFVPLAMIFAGVFAIIIDSSASRIKIIIVALLVALPVAIYLFVSMQSEIFQIVISGNESYNNLGSQESGDTSLGSRLITSASIPTRLILGSAYLFIFPIPFWSGFQFESVYHLFKSLQALYMYGITPLFILAVWKVIRYKNFRTIPHLFLLFLSIGFTLAIAFTSLETRHFATFLVPILILSSSPDLTQKEVKSAYHKLLWIFIGLMVAIHFVWIVIKLL